MTRLYSDLVNAHGYPLYVYEETSLATQLGLLRKSLPDFTVLYSVKTCPHPAICRFMAENGVGADAASGYEVQRALKAGIVPERILYSAPGKSMKDLEGSLGKCLIIADSYLELSRLDLVSEGLAAGNSKLRVGLRINPDMSFGIGEYPAPGPGVASKFGVDEESLAEQTSFFRSLHHIRPVGIHVFLRSQVLNHTAIASSFEKAFSIALFCRETLGWEISFINFGGGFGIHSALSLGGLNMDALAAEIGNLVKAYKPRLPGAEFFLESGRFLVGQAGTFVTRIEDIKESRGKTFVIAPGCLNGFLRPAVAELLAGLPCEAKGPLEPLFSNRATHQVKLSENQDGALKSVTVCGNLCTALDAVAKDVMLPSPKVGDILTISNAGAYGASLSPFAFGSFPRPLELYRTRQGDILTS